MNEDENQNIKRHGCIFTDLLCSQNYNCTIWGP